MQTTDKSNFLIAEAELALDEVSVTYVRDDGISNGGTFQARKTKAEKIKDLGQPIQLAGIALDLHIEENFAWIAENTQVIRKVDLEVRITLYHRCHEERRDCQVERKDCTIISRPYRTCDRYRIL